MTTPRKSQTISVHRTRQTARRQERAIQELLDTGYTKRTLDEDVLRVLTQNAWIKGARVEKAGAFQFTVVGTSTKGR